MLNVSATFSIALFVKHPLFCLCAISKTGITALCCLLDGYFSGDSYISKNSIKVSSISYELIEGISVLLSKLGIFSKISLSKFKSPHFCVPFGAQKNIT